MKTTKEKVSYCIGLETGRNLKQQFADMETELLRQGFLDALEGTPPKLAQDEVISIMQSLRQQIEQQQKEFITKLAEDNKNEGEAFLESNKRKEGVVALSSGLQYKVLQKGSGAKPSLTDVVSVHYRGTFLDGQVFDSSYERGKPQVFPVNRVIPGWSQALQLMQVGDKVQVFIPHYLAYGEAGFGDDIPPCTTLVFEMELLGIEQGN
jgi:FKBP-type peptidyl-prolyl cis-trans isomerase FklB